MGEDDGHDIGHAQLLHRFWCVLLKSHLIFLLEIADICKSIMLFVKLGIGAIILKKMQYQIIVEYVLFVIISIHLFWVNDTKSIVVYDMSLSNIWKLTTIKIKLYI